MENNRIMSVLCLILAVACTIVAYTLATVKHKADYIPGEAISDIIEILERDNIRIDRSIIPEKRIQGTVYVFGSDGYNNTVAELLGGERVKDVYVIPDGELLILENGDVCEFGSSFTFKYRAFGADSFSPNIADLQNYTTLKSEADAEESVAAVQTFLGNGSSEFNGDSTLKISVVIDSIWEYSGVDYLLCSRTIDGVKITGNLVLCTVEDGEVVAAYGTWCFFTPGKSYSAQLTDILNILFNMKKNLAGTSAADTDGITVESLKSCYSLYFFGEEENFCLIPCWQITTDTSTELIYNAIDGTLYTKT